METKGSTAALVLGLLFFYIVIIMYIFFGVIHDNAGDNFITALFFEFIGFMLLAFLVMVNILAKLIKTGFFVPLIMVTVIYTLILDVLNMVLIGINHRYFLLVNLVLLLIYGVIATPMYIMGRK